MMGIFKILPLIILPFLVSSCKINAETTDDYDSFIFPVHETFHEIIASNAVKVRFSHADTYQVELVGKLTDDVNVEIKKGTLYIRGLENAHAIDNQDVVVNVYAPVINKVIIESSSFEADNIFSDDILFIQSLKEGEITLNNLNAKTCVISAQKESNIDIKHIKSEKTTLNCFEQSSLHVYSMEIDYLCVNAQQYSSILLSGNTKDFMIHACYLSLLNIEDLLYKTMIIDGDLINEMFF